ncbi:MAG TPA: inorganic diphosphatase [Steroidobacteraceae bacterium]|nr:inorganic diphosphatase [Steroidobacteraceae bacterium]
MSPPHGVPPTSGPEALMRLPARAGRGLVHVIIDTPRGSSQKYKYDPELRGFKLSRMLPLGMHFPFDFGSIPGTRAADGDALDVILISEHASFVGCLFKARLIGVLEAEQREGGRRLRNDRLLAVPTSPVNAPLWRHVRELPRRMLDELEQFFVSYNRVHGREFEPLGRGSPAAAERLLNAAAKLFQHESS